MKIRLHHAALALAACPAIANAQGFTDPAAIDREVASFLGVSPAEAGSAFMPVDRRLRLAYCGNPLQLGWQGTRRDSVIVQCPDMGGWKIYVRVMGQAAQQQLATPVVKRGDAVSVTVKGSGFSVSQTGEALESGAIGEWVRIRMSKDTELRGRVLRPGAIALDMP